MTAFRDDPNLGPAAFVAAFGDADAWVAAFCDPDAVGAAFCDWDAVGAAFFFDDISESASFEGAAGCGPQRVMNGWSSARDGVMRSLGSYASI